MKNQAPRQHNPQSGSIFIWLFVMVALFGALSYAMLQGSRTGASTMTAEQAKLQVSEILTQAQAMDNVIKQLRINGCTDEQISFEGDTTISGNYTNTNTPSDGRCKVFDANGGGLRWQKPASGLGDAFWAVLGNHCYKEVGGPATCAPETTELELDLIDIPDILCMEINKSSGIENPSNAPPHENYSATPPNSGIFKGTYTGGNGTPNIIENIGANGKRYGCYKDDTGSLTGKNVFYYILIAR